MILILQRNWDTLFDDKKKVHIYRHKQIPSQWRSDWVTSGRQLLANWRSVDVRSLLGWNLTSGGRTTCAAHFIRPLIRSRKTHSCQDYRGESNKKDTARLSVTLGKRNITQLSSIWVCDLNRGWYLYDIWYVPRNWKNLSSTASERYSMHEGRHISKQPLPVETRRDLKR